MIRRALLALLVAAPAGMAWAQDMFTLKPIVKAVREGDDEKVRQALLAKKADPNTPDFTGRTAVAYARQSGHTTIEAMLRKAGGRE
jgi:ankyrin repeat protein